MNSFIFFIYHRINGCLDIISLDEVLYYLCDKYPNAERWIEPKVNDWIITPFTEY